MGGGDLNMKKHFHPLTRENLEKVWKAEQKRDQEIKRIEERTKEIAEEKARDELLEHASRHGVIKKREERLEWMYAGYRTTSEDFLLGKEITDEVIEKAAQQRKLEHVKSQTGVQGSLQTVDLARKIREDPLFLIKKREAMISKELMQNTARIKQLIQSSKRDPQYSTTARKIGHTPGHSKLSKVGWDTPSRHNTPRRAGKPPHLDSARRRDESDSDPEENERKLQKMLSNGKWREDSRRKNIDKVAKEEELDKKIEEAIGKLKGSSSTRSVLDDIKMGNYSSKRYTKN